MFEEKARQLVLGARPFGLDVIPGTASALTELSPDRLDLAVEAEPLVSIGLAANTRMQRCELLRAGGFLADGRPNT